MVTCVLVLVTSVATRPGLAADDPFAAAIRPTGPLAAAEEQKTFHLPPGFRIELFASEPDVQKPINMAFDSRGRLWVAGSTDYPFPAKPGTAGRDSIRILDDTNGDGRADKITTFADGLTIPMGVYPYRQGAIAFSVPYIYYLADTDGDDRADLREVLYGPVGYERDTHGMNNAFRRGFDGWIYACHGFANQTTLEGRDGSKITMHSGNTYRFRPDGSHVEQFTYGQVNPFGMTLDPWGHIFTADCHTKPIMLLLRGGFYDSFGRPHDGLGYVPAVMKHEHGSTAIAGTTYYTGSMFPAEYQGNMFVGNVMTSRVNRDSLDFIGSTIQAREQPDFIWTDDPWFRPVDLQVGLDGALYVADFYNKIIAHVEVPLDHPGRDHERGRIWRVTYQPKSAPKTKSQRPVNLSTAPVSELIAALDDPSLPVRMRATDELSDRIGNVASPPLEKLLAGAGSPQAKVHALWALFRLSALPTATLLASARDSDSILRVHALRVLGETQRWSPALHAVALRGLADSDPFARRAAIDALGQHPNAADVRPLLALWHATPTDDVHLLHTLKMAIRNALAPAGNLPRVVAGSLAAADRNVLADVCLGLRNEESGAYLLEYLRSHDRDEPATSAFLTHIAKYLPAANLDEIAGVAQEKVKGQIDLQLDLLLAVRAGMLQRGLPASTSIRDWAKTLAGELLTSTESASTDWTSLRPDGLPDATWDIEWRGSADGNPPAPFLSSLSLGERWTGSLRSREFVIPDSLRFFVCGHLGFPDQPIVPHNWVRLRITGSNDVIAEAQPPRSDVAQPVNWNLTTHAGQRGYLEIVDGVDAPAYAWIAVGRFDPPVVKIPSISPKFVVRRQSAAAELVAALDLREFESPLRQLAANVDQDVKVRATAASALAKFSGDPAWIALTRLVDEPATPSTLRDAICGEIVKTDRSAAETLLVEAMKSAPQRTQTMLAEGLAGTQTTAEMLLALIEQGRASAYLLGNPGLRQRVIAAAPVNAARRIENLTAGLPSRDEALEKQMTERRMNYATSGASSERGLAIFKQRCAICHQIAGQGVVIGPQLDGIGNRGLDRIVEDVLDSNRNIDQAFRTTFYVLRDGRIVSGLFRREEGELVVVADQQGKEQSFAMDLIDEQQPSQLSLMPDNFGKQIPEAEFYDLLAYLMAQRVSPSADSGAK